MEATARGVEWRIAARRFNGLTAASTLYVMSVGGLCLYMARSVGGGVFIALLVLTWLSDIEAALRGPLGLSPSQEAGSRVRRTWSAIFRVIALAVLVSQSVAVLPPILAAVVILGIVLALDSQQSPPSKLTEAMWASPRFFAFSAGVVLHVPILALWSLPAAFVVLLLGMLASNRVASRITGKALRTD